MLDVCLSHETSPSQKPLCFPCCSAALLLGLIPLTGTPGPGRCVYLPRGAVKLVLFYPVWVLRAFNRRRNLCRWGFLSARFQRSWSTIKVKLLESTRLLGIDPSVWVCVCVCVCVQLSAARGVDLQHASRVYFRPITHTHRHTHTHTHTPLGAEGALFITVTFPFKTQPKSSHTHIHVSCAPCCGTIPTT